MADESLNPGDNVRLDRLERGLRELGDGLANRLRNIERGVAESTQVSERQLGREAVRERDARAAEPRLPLAAARGAEPIARGESIDRRAGTAARDLQRVTGRTSADELSMLSRAEQQLAVERNIGLARARNLQVLQRQSALLGGPAGIRLGAAPRATSGGVVLPPGYSRVDPAEMQARTIARTLQETFRGMPLALPAAGQTSNEFSRLANALNALTSGRGPDLVGGGGGGRIPPIPPTAAGGASDEPDRNLRDRLGANRHVQEAVTAETRAQIAAEEALARAKTSASGAIGQMNARLAESTRTLAIGSNAMRAHGALTTEFIQAAARGQTTFSELGFQVGATIGKFGGWTAAAAAVYGVLGAVGKLKTGALDSLQGVNLLQRVVNNLDTEQAQRSFRDLALTFNLPVGEVVQTAYEASKAFKDQRDAMLATKAALYGVKVGEIDAADAGRLVTATARGFHLQASELIPVMNTVNALQNAFGSNFKGVAQGVAQAAGAFGAAGGNYQQLAAAVATVTQVTGIQGPNAATALRRTSELAFRPERRQGILDALGIDTRDASTTIADILSRATALVAKGRNPLEVAKLITTPELASRAIAPLLAAGPLYQERLRVAEHPGDSAERERKRAVQSMHDQLARTGTEFEVLGSNLAQAGAFNALGGFLRLLNTSLGEVNHLVDAFNELPKPVREAVTYFGQLVALLGLMRRFDVGATIGRRFPAAGGILGRSPQGAGRAQVLQGLGDERRFLQERGQGIGNERALTQYSAVRAAERHEALIASGASDEELLRSRERVDELTRRATTLSEDQADIQARINTNLAQENEFRARTSIRQRQGVEEAAVASGIPYTNPTLNRNVPVSAVPIGGAAGATPGRPVPMPMYSAPIGPVTEQAAAVEHFQRQQNTLRRAIDEERQVWARGVGTEGRVSRSLGTLSGAVVFAGRGMRNTGTALRGVGTAMLDFISDPFVAIMAAFLAFESTLGYIQTKARENRQQLSRLNERATPSTDEMRRTARQELGQRSLMDRASNVVARDINALDPFGNPARSQDQAQDAAARARIAAADQIDELNNNGKAFTRPQITQRLNENLRRAGGSQKDVSAAFDQAAREAGFARGYVFASTPAQLKKAVRDIRDFTAALHARQVGLKSVREGYDDAIRSITDTESADAFTKGLTTNISLFGVNRKRAGAAGLSRGRILTLISQLDKNSPDYSDQVGKFLQDIDTAQQAVIQSAMDRLNHSLVTAGPGRSASLRRGAISNVRRATIGGLHRTVQQLDARIRDRSRTIGDTKRQIDALDRDTTTDLTVGPGGLLAAGTMGRLPTFHTRDNEARKRTALRALKAAQINDRHAIKVILAAMGLTRQAFDDFARQEEQAAFDAQTALLESKAAGNPTQQANIAASRARQLVGLAKHGKVTTPVVQAMADANNAAEEARQAGVQAASDAAQQFQQELQLQQARQEASGASDQTVLRGNIARAQNFLAYARGHRLERSSIIDAEIAVYQARKALADSIQSDADGLLQAQEQLALSRTEDPVKQATISVRYAQRRLAAARNETDRIQRQADLNNAIRSRRNAAQQDRYDDITFMADMGEIGKQTEISMLNTLLHSMHGNRDLRRQIRRQIHDLNKQANDDATLDLNVGSIRLPTVYDVRRMIRQGVGAGAQVHQENSYHFEIHDGADVEAFGAAYERVTNQAILPSMRSAGVL